MVRVDSICMDAISHSQKNHPGTVISTGMISSMAAGYFSKADEYLAFDNICRCSIAVICGDRAIRRICFSKSSIKVSFSFLENEFHREDILRLKDTIKRTTFVSVNLSNDGKLILAGEINIFDTLLSRRTFDNRERG